MFKDKNQQLVVYLLFVINFDLSFTNNHMSKLSLLSLIMLVVLCLGCEQAGKRPKEKKVKKLEGMVKHYYEDGSLASEITYKDKKRHGYAKGYYKGGALQGEFNYENGELHGINKIYHLNGRVYRESPYTNGKIDGIQKLYRKDGSLLAEVPYKEGELGVGTKEYTADGKLKKQLPELMVQHIDKLLKDDQYIVRITLTEKDKKARFYVGELTEGKYKGDKLRFMPAKDGVLELIYPLPPGAFVMETVHVVAETKTKMDTPYLLSTKINIAAENKGY